MAIDLDFEVFPEQGRFLQSTATIAVAVSPQGEGKTFIGAVSMICHAAEYYNRTRAPMRGCVIRDTHENIKTMTVPSIISAINTTKTKLRFKNDFKKLTGRYIDIDLFGIAEPGRLTRLQGAEYSFIWIEEPAPIIEKGSAGISLETFMVALSRVARQKDAIPRLQVTMNPADEDHWTYNLFIENCPFNNPQHPDYPDVTLELINLPYGANPNRKDIEKQTVKAAYRDRPDLYARYVEGRWAFVQAGMRVVPNYNEEYHRAKFRLDPMPMSGYQTYRFWDGGLNPTCIFIQVTPRGRLYVTDTFRGEEMGMKQFLSTFIKPAIAMRYDRIDDWTDIGDPSMTARDPADSEVSVARIIEKELNTTFMPGVSDWHPRREAIIGLCGDMVDGVTRLLLSHHEGILHRALRGGWHFAKDPSGKVIRDKPVKDIHSHPGDALSHGIAKIRPADKRRNLRVLDDHHLGRSYAVDVEAML